MRQVFLLALLISTSFALEAQQEQAGRDLAASFPQISNGASQPDLPADGFWWDPTNPGWGINIEIQKRSASSTGYFLFGSGYFYDEEGKSFWCAFSDEFKYNTNVFEWRDKKSFSNLPFGHDNEDTVLAEQIVECNIMGGGSPISSETTRVAQIVDTINLQLLWRTPSKLEVTTNGVTHNTVRFGFGDDLQKPSLDWVTDTYWSMKSVDGVYGSVGSTGVNSKGFYNSNTVTNFKRFDMTNQQNVLDFVGHQEHWEYYISNTKNSIKITTFFDSDNPLADIFAPYINGSRSNRQWIVLIHDNIKNRIMLYTVAGEKEPQKLSANAGISYKFVADVNPDADVIDFYPFMCEGTGFGHGQICETNFSPTSIENMATWSEQNIHASTLKLFKLRTGGKAYRFTPNNGESDSQSTNRIKNQLIEEGILPAES